MKVDKVPAKFSIFEKMLDGGDAGRRRVEHRSFLQLSITHTKKEETGHRPYIECSTILL